MAAYQELARVTVGDLPRSTLFSNGSIWCANFNASTVTRINPVTGATIATITLAGNNPQALTEDDLGYVWAASSAAGGGSVFGLHRINPATNTVNQTLGANTAYASVSFADGDLIVSRSGGGGVTSRVDTTTFAFTNISKASPAGYSNGPKTSAYDGTLLWLTNFNNDAVYGLDSTNAYVQTVTGINDPQQCVYAFGQLWVCGRTGGFYRINVSTYALTTVATGGHTGVTFDASYVYITDNNGTFSRVRKVDPTSLAVTSLWDGPLADVAFDPVFDGANKIWYSASGVDQLVQIGQVGGIFTDGAAHL